MRSTFPGKETLLADTCSTGYCTCTDARLPPVSTQARRTSVGQTALKGTAESKSCNSLGLPQIAIFNLMFRI